MIGKLRIAGTSEAALLFVPYAFAVWIPIKKSQKIENSISFKTYPVMEELLSLR